MTQSRYPHSQDYMHYQPGAITRLARFQSLIPHSSVRLNAIAPSLNRTFITHNLKSVTKETMGKDKVNFHLKTPKGTKDCKNTLTA